MSKEKAKGSLQAHISGRRSLQSHPSTERRREKVGGERRGSGNRTSKLPLEPAVLLCSWIGTEAINQANEVKVRLTSEAVAGLPLW